MNFDIQQNTNPKLDEVYMLIFNIADGNYDILGNTSPNGDEIDALITGLNMLAEELKAKFEKTNR